MKTNNKAGFTLIELLVAATIIIVLSAIGIVSYMNAGKSARDSRRKADIETVRQAMVLYRAENGVYPSGGGTGHNTMIFIIRGEDLVNAGYLSEPKPVDPKNVSPYYYTASSTPVAFCLCAQLETNKGNRSARTCGSYDTTGGFYCVQQP